jgi:hypothetical protein
MKETGIVRVKFETLKSFYPTYKTLPKELQAFMDGLNKISPGNTPCCVQVSHALNKAGVIIPSKSFRRSNSKIGSFFYLLAVDELEQYLAANFGRGEELKKAGATRTTAEMKAQINGKQGILVFRNAGAGHHTELWDSTHILQDGKAVSGGGAVKNEANIFGQPRVLFWQTLAEPTGTVTVPSWLKGWWKVWDGNTYYYYFTDHHVVTYVKTAPANLALPPLKMPLNEGSVSISADTTKVIIDWNPADGGATKETFTRALSDTKTMNGVSNRYSPLVATKM